ncbi:MAG: hypothetical protein MUF22_03150, partial [Chitinispirillaceae bacterium]|nr:hypothetical protein [Chitinispirillaceae bacterium]
HPGIEKLSLRGQLALDDFQVDNEAVGDQEPSHWGIDAGVYWRDPLLLPMHSLLKAGYCRRSEWLYTVPDNNMEAGEGYTFLSKSLGYPKNDGDEIWVGASVIGKTPWVGSAMISYGREGDKNVNSFWFDNIPGNTPGLPFDYAAGQFPSGTVMNTVSFSLEGSAYVCAFADASFMINNRWIKNKNHQATPFVYAPVFSASLGLHLSNLHFALPQ